MSESARVLAPKLLDVDAVMECTSLSRSAAYELMKRLPHIRLGRQGKAIRVHQVTLERYLEIGGDSWRGGSSVGVAFGTSGGTTRTARAGANRRSSTTAKPPKSSLAKLLADELSRAPKLRPSRSETR